MAEAITLKQGRVTPHVALYTRVSTREQVEEGHSLEQQQNSLERWCEEQFGQGGYTSSLYCDEGYSGGWGLGKPYGTAPQFRPRLTEMVADIEAERIDVVVYWRIDRITRSASLWARILDEYFIGMGVRAVSIKEGFDLGTPHGRLAAGIMVQIASYFREWTADNVKEACLRRKELGYPHGTPPFGWRWQTEDEIVPGERRGFAPIPEQGQWVGKVAGWYLSGWSPDRIAKELNSLQVAGQSGKVAWSASTVRNLLLCPTHAGVVKAPQGIIRARHWDERLYDETTYLQILDLARQRSTMSPSTLRATHYLLAGTLECGSCGCKLFGFRSAEDDKLYYRCEHRDTPDGPNCPGITKQAALLHAAVIDCLGEMAQSDQLRQMTDDQVEKLVDAQETDLDGEVRRLRQEYQRLDKTYVGYMRMRADGEISREDCQRQSEPVRLEREALMARITEFEEQRDARDLRHRNASEVRDAIVAFPELWEHLDDDEKRRFLQLTVEQLVLSGPSESASLHIKIRHLPERQVFLPNVRTVGSRRRTGVESLTIREMELLDLRHQGFTVPQIAVKWDIAPEFIHSTRSAMLRRLGAADVHAAYELAKERIEAHRHLLHTKQRRKKDGRSDRWRPTERQLQIVRNRLFGMTAEQSADAMGVVKGTISTTIALMKRRAGVQTFDELVAKIVAWGLIEAPPEDAAPADGSPPPASLGPLQHRVWALHCAGKSHAEIAEEVSIQRSAVVQHVSVIRKKLRAWLEASGQDSSDDAALKAVPTVVGVRKW